jgi:hypothetical protein
MVAAMKDVTGPGLVQLYVDFQSKPAHMKISEWALNKSHQETEDAPRQFWRDVFYEAKKRGI